MNKFYFYKPPGSVLSWLAGFMALLLVPDFSFGQQMAPAGFNQAVLGKCHCTDNIISPKKGTRFYQSISTFTNYSELQQATGWMLSGKEKTFKSLYFENFHSDIGSSSGQEFFMSVVAINTSVEFTHPDNTYTINLTPCINDAHIFKLPFTLDRSYDILNYDRNFNYKDFDHTSQAYLRIIFLRLALQPDIVLKGLLTEMIDNDGPKLPRFSRFIKIINKKYNISVPEASLDTVKDQTYIPLIFAAIKSKYINPEEVINDEFVSTGQTSHPMNTTEKANLLAILNQFYEGEFDLDNIDDELLRPKYSVELQVKHIGIELSDKVIRAWDVANKRPVLDSNKKTSRSTILAEVSDLEFSSDKGTSAKVKNVCFPTSEISGTGILLNFNHAKMVDIYNQTETGFSKYNYPLFRIVLKPMNKNKPADDVTVAAYDTLITKFSGLLVEDALISIPFKSDTIHTSVKNLIMNNKLISGEIVIKTEQVHDPSNENISINTRIGIMVVNIKELQKTLNNKGIKDLRFDRNKDSVVVFFKKIVK
jgi:hypothetical protein